MNKGLKEVIDELLEQGVDITAQINEQIDQDGDIGNLGEFYEDFVDLNEDIEEFIENNSGDLDEEAVKKLEALQEKLSMYTTLFNMPALDDFINTLEFDLSLDYKRMEQGQLSNLLDEMMESGEQLGALIAVGVKVQKEKIAALNDDVIQRIKILKEQNDEFIKPKIETFLTETAPLISNEIHEYDDFTPKELEERNSKLFNAMDDIIILFGTLQDEASEKLFNELESKMQARFIEFNRHYGEITWLQVDAALEKTKKSRVNASVNNIRIQLEQLKEQSEILSEAQEKLENTAEVIKGRINALSDESTEKYKELKKQYNDICDIKNNLDELGGELDSTKANMADVVSKYDQGVIKANLNASNVFITEFNAKDLDKMDPDDLEAKYNEVEKEIVSIRSFKKNVNNLKYPRERKSVYLKACNTNIKRLNQFKAKILLARAKMHVANEITSVDDAKSALNEIFVENIRMDQAFIISSSSFPVDDQASAFNELKNGLLKTIEASVGVSSVIESVKPLEKARENFSEEEVRAVAGKATAQNLDSLAGRLAKKLSSLANVDEELIDRVENLQTDLEVILEIEPIDVSELLDLSKELSAVLEESSKFGGVSVIGWKNAANSLETAMENFTQAEQLSSENLLALDKNFTAKLAYHMNEEESKKFDEFLSKEQNCLSVMYGVKDKNIHDQIKIRQEELNNLREELSAGRFVKEVIAEMEGPEQAVKDEDEYVEEAGKKVLGTEVSKELKEKFQKEEKIITDEGQPELEDIIAPYEKTKNIMMKFSREHLGKFISGLQNKLVEAKNDLTEATSSGAQEEDVQELKGNIQNIEISLQLAQDVMAKWKSASPKKQNVERKEIMGTRKSWVKKGSEEVGEKVENQNVKKPGESKGINLNKN